MFKFFIPKFTKKQYIILCLLFAAVLYFIFLPAIQGMEPNKIIFLLIWLAGAIFVITLFRSVLSDLFAKNMPYKYDDLKLKYGTAQTSFRVYLSRVGAMSFRGFYAKIDGYDKFFIISIWGHAIYVDDIKYVQFKSSFILGNVMEINCNDAHISCIISKKQYEYISKLLK